MNKGTYTNLKGKSADFNYTDSITLSQKLSFATEYSGMVVSGALGYAYMLEEPIFNYCLVKYFTDITVFEKDSDFNLDMLEKFLTDNRQNIIVPILECINGSTIDALYKACDKAVEFRKVRFGDHHEEISDLLQAVKELVAKPDYMNELLIALTNAVNSFADHSDIDMGVVNKLADIIPVMKDMGGVEVAKAIISTQNNEAQSAKSADKPKSTRGRKPKTAESKVINISEATKSAAPKGTSTKEDKQ